MTHSKLPPRRAAKGRANADPKAQRAAPAPADIYTPAHDDRTRAPRQPSAWLAQEDTPSRDPDMLALLRAAEEEGDGEEEPADR